jgi:hypothetical protein
VTLRASVLAIAQCSHTQRILHAPQQFISLMLALDSLSLVHTPSIGLEGREVASQGRILEQHEDKIWGVRRESSDVSCRFDFCTAQQPTMNEPIIIIIIK